MASTQDLKRRVRSITNTRKLTKAMELVASARLRRAQQRIEAMRPYADRMLELMAGVSQAAGAVRLPLLRDGARRRARRDRAGHRRPRAGGRVQRPGAPPRLRAACARSQAAGQEVGLVPRRGRRPARRFASGGSRSARRGSGFSDRPGVQRRAGDGARARRGVHERRGRPGRRSSTTRSSRRSSRR